MIPAEHIERARKVPIERVIEERGIKLRGRIERVGPCQVCGGTDRFSINIKKQVFNCRGCNTGGDVIALVRHLDGVDFATACSTLAGPPPKRRDSDTSKNVVVATYEYHDANGGVVFIKDRVQFKKPDGTFVLKDGKPDKTFRQRRPDPDRPGEWLPNVDGVPVLPYQLPALTEAVAAEHPVLIVEGEAKVNLLAKWNLAATCNSGGSGKWKAEHSRFLRDADVVLVPDNDDAGWEHINIVGASLKDIAKSVRVLVLPHLPPKGDIVDWAKAGGTREQLDALINDAQDWKPQTAGEIDKWKQDQKAKAKTREDELLNALAKVQGLDYDRQRKAAAKELGVSPRALDDEVKARREDAQAAPLYGHWIVEPWPDPVDGDSLLRDIINRIQRHVVISDDGALVIALWIMFAWVHDAIATHSPILNINSTDPECGKSTAMDLIAFLMPKCIATVNATEAAIYRSIKRWSPSFCFDEFDDVMKDDKRAGLKQVINSGHARGQGVLRCEGDDKVPELFPTFAAKCLGMVGKKLPAATLSRCIFVELRRRKKEETVERFTREDDDGLRDLRGRLRRWSLDNEDRLRNAKPSIPDELLNRREDNWRVQLAIADLCDGVEGFGEKARLAAIKIEVKSDNTTLNARLLADIKALFDADKLAEGMHSADVVAKLLADPEKSWGDAFTYGKPLTQNRLAKTLGGYGIISVNIKISGVQAKGYRRSDFEEAWARYV